MPNTEARTAIGAGGDKLHLPGLELAAVEGHMSSIDGTNAKRESQSWIRSAPASGHGYGSAYLKFVLGAETQGYARPASRPLLENSRVEMIIDANKSSKRGHELRRGGTLTGG